MKLKVACLGLFASIALAGCTTNKDGSTSFGARGSSAWAANGPQEEVFAYYDSQSVAELCETWRGVSWQASAQSIVLQIAKSLSRRGMDPLYCDKLCRAKDGQCRPKMFPWSP